MLPLRLQGAYSDFMAFIFVRLGKCRWRQSCRGNLPKKLRTADKVWMTGAGSSRDPNPQDQSTRTLRKYTSLYIPKATTSGEVKASVGSAAEWYSRGKSHFCRSGRSSADSNLQFPTIEGLHPQSHGFYYHASGRDPAIKVFFVAKSSRRAFDKESVSHKFAYIKLHMHNRAIRSSLITMDARTDRSI